MSLDRNLFSDSQWGELGEEWAVRKLKRLFPNRKRIVGFEHGDAMDLHGADVLVEDGTGMFHLFQVKTSKSVAKDSQPYYASKGIDMVVANPATGKVEVLSNNSLFDKEQLRMKMLTANIRVDEINAENNHKEV